jgi:putative acetyltransferase
VNLSVVVEMEASGDEGAIHQLNVNAFDGRTEEADLVDALREAGDLILSLVARYQGEIVGHVAFSRVSIDAATGPAGGVALAPVGVRSDVQDRGVGLRLIVDGIELLAQRGESVILVVGSPAYYTRFGFSVTEAEQYPCDYSGPYFMALQISGTPAPATGPVTYPDAFDMVN